MYRPGGLLHLGSCSPSRHRGPAGTGPGVATTVPIGVPFLSLSVLPAALISTAQPAWSSRAAEKRIHGPSPSLWPVTLATQQPRLAALGDPKPWTWRVRKRSPGRADCLAAGDGADRPRIPLPLTGASRARSLAHLVPTLDPGKGEQGRGGVGLGGAGGGCGSPIARLPRGSAAHPAAARPPPPPPTSSSSVTVFLQLCSRVVKLDVVGEL